MLLFKFPFNPTIYSTDGAPGEQNVRFVSFDESKALAFEGEIVEVPLGNILANSFTTDRLKNIPSREIPQETQAEYTEKLGKVVGFIKENSLQKLVISRVKQVNYSDLSANGGVDLHLSFLNMCQAYPNAFAYLFHREETCWMGAFSELLGRYNKKTSEFETMSLAGTLPVSEPWTQKEIDEQKPVSSYIRHILEKYSGRIEVSETYDHLSGNIKHLRTDYRARINADELDHIISDLHPTPAVCGIPKDFCMNAIAHFENQPRNFYSGYIRIETEDFIQYFVNLRCAAFTGTEACLHVGGGITSQSSPEHEWRETELKAEAVLKNLATV